MHCGRHPLLPELATSHPTGDILLLDELESLALHWKGPVDPAMKMSLHAMLFTILATLEESFIF